MCRVVAEMNCRDGLGAVEHDMIEVYLVRWVSLGTGCLCRDRVHCLDLGCRSMGLLGWASGDLVHLWMICRERVV